MKTPFTELIEDITKETKYILAQEPEDITNLYAGILPNDAGAGGQYFSTLVFAFADMRSVSMLYMGTGLLRAIDDDDFSLSQCKRLIEYGNLKIGTSFLEYCGFQKLGEFSGRLMNIYKSAETKKDLRDLVNVFFNYIWILYGWTIQKFPWGLGAGVYRKKTKDEFAKIGERFLRFSQA